MKTTSFEARIKELRLRLQKAVEIELTTIPPYLITALSIKPGSNSESKNIIRSVFMEEMLHMLLAANTLTAIGGKLELGRRNIPKYPCKLEFKGKAFNNREFEINLQSFSPEAIEIFKQIELPDGFAPDSSTQKQLEVVIPGYTLGDFYRGIIAELKDLCSKYEDTKVFSGNPYCQLNEEYFWSGGGRPIVVINMDSAEKALNEIIEQGEGSDGSIMDGDNAFEQPNEVSHYFRFNEIAFGRRYQADDNPHEAPTGKPLVVDYSAVFPIKTNCRTSDFKGNKRLLALNRNFNKAYSFMLAQIAEAFNGNQKVLYTAVMNGMHKLSPIAIEMMQISLPSEPDKTAAPTFSWVQPASGVNTRRS